MASLCKRSALTPSQANQQRTKLDELLDPALFKALGEPRRAQLLSCLLKCSRPCSVSELAACCSVDFSTVARHLSTLARAGLASAVKKGRVVWYEVDGASLASRLRALADAVEELTPRGDALRRCGGERADAWADHVDPPPASGAGEPSP
ncbi:MAG: transcriptional regulator [Planctomycetota bacterium]|nr:MAG: transcriptional regulator [Planctomycetota bacterium]